MSEHPEPQERDLTGQIGPLVVDWPRTVDYYTAIGLAVAFEAIEPPVGLFIAAVPFLKMLNRPRSRKTVRLLSQFFDGAAQPVGGSAESTITLTGREQGRAKLGESLFREARRLADRVKAPAVAANGKIAR